MGKKLADLPKSEIQKTTRGLSASSRGSRAAVVSLYLRKSIHSFKGCNETIAWRKTEEITYFWEKKPPSRKPEASLVRKKSTADGEGRERGWSGLWVISEWRPPR